MLTVPSHISSFGFEGRWVVAERQQASRFNLAFQPSIVLRKLDACRRADANSASLGAALNGGYPFTVGSWVVS